MPYTTKKVKGKGTCVYKKSSDKKVGCTTGPINKYLAALHVNEEIKMNDLNRFGKMFMKLISEAPVDMSPPEEGAEGMPPVESPALKGELQTSQDNANELSVQLTSQQQALKSQLEKWINEAKNFAEQIGGIESGSWAVEIRKVFPNPQEADNVIKQLSKGSKVLDEIKNQLSAISNRIGLSDKAQ